jgi:L-lactate dehydrogenase complex protein LldG
MQMMQDDSEEVLAKVRRALGHVKGTVTPPAPPAIEDALARMVAKDADLGEVFAKYAKEQKMLIARATAGDVAQAVVDFVKQQPIRRIALAASERIARLGIESALKAAGYDVRRWDESSLDGMYEFDCAVTDVECAVAENATLVIRPSAEQGRSMSLVPMFHIAIVETSQIVPDMIELFEQLGRDANRSSIILITGPSKTADIEMNVVTGVHGPNVVQVFLLP